MFKRVLLTTDGSPVVERQILYAEHLARVEPAELLVFHAYMPPLQYAGLPGYEELLQHYQAVAQALADDAVEALREAGVEASAEVRAAPAGDAIIEAAREFDADLILMGMRSGYNVQAMLGSVSAYVLRHAHCPVLQIP